MDRGGTDEGMDLGQRTVIETLNVDSINALFWQMVEAAKDRIDGLGAVIQTSGTLKKPSTRGYAYAYADLTDGNIAVNLEIPKDKLAQVGLVGGEYVSVVGILRVYRKPGKEVGPRLRVSELVLAEAPAVSQQRRQDQMALREVVELPRHRQPFPYGKAIRVSLIHSKSSQVINDFKNALDKAESGIGIEKIPVTVRDPSQVKEAIVAATGDILVLIRGGGAAEDFQSFNSKEVVVALAEKKAYRISALGHSADVTLADWVVDYAADTPTAAGTFIRDRLNADSVRIRAILASKENEAQSLRDKIRNDAEESRLAIRRLKFRWISFAGLAAVVVLCLLGYYLSTA